MNVKSLGVLLISTIIIAIAAVTVYMGRSAAAPESTAGSKLFPELGSRANDVATIRVTTATETFDIRRDGSVWRLESKAGYPASFEQAKQMIIGLSELKIIEPKTSDPAMYDRLGVGTSREPGSTATAVALIDEDDGLIAGLLIGNSAPGGRGDHRYVRRLEDAQAQLVSGTLRPVTDPLEWIDRQVLQVERDRFARVTIEHADGEQLTVERDASGGAGWVVVEIPAGFEEQRPGVANPVGTVLSTTRLEDVMLRSDLDPAVEARVTVHAETADGLWIDAQVWASDAGDWVTFDAGSLSDAGEAGAEEILEEAETLRGRFDGWAYRLSEFQLGNLTKRPADMLKAAEPAEAEADGPPASP